jgi:hypothetical protein
MKEFVTGSSARASSSDPNGFPSKREMSQTSSVCNHPKRFCKMLHHVVRLPRGHRHHESDQPDHIKTEQS